jgi:two-component system, response regulator PdtaR
VGLRGVAVVERLRILIADDDTDVSSGLAAMLENLGHSVAACAYSGTEAVEKTNRLSPDLVIMDIKMHDISGIEASRRILEQQPLPIVILSAFSHPELIEEADEAGVAGYMVKPFTQDEIQPVLTLARSRFRQLQALKLEVGDLKETIRSRKLIEQAKGLLMEREGLSEAEAFRRIQCMSRNQNIPMAKIAEAVIMTGKLMNTKPNPCRRES